MDIVKQKGGIVDYFLLFLLISTSGFPLFYRSIQYIVIGMLFSGIVFFYRKKTIDKSFFYILFLFIIVQISQGFIFDYFSFTTYFGLYLRLFFAYFTIKILGVSFFEKYVKFLTFFIVVSLILFFLILIIPAISYYLSDNLAKFFVDPFQIVKSPTDKNIIIFNFFGTQGEYGILRNSGPFWEPGAFGGYLLIGIYFNYLIYKKIFNKFGILALIALITTFSTTSYIAYLSFIFFISLSSNKQYKYKLLVNSFLILSIGIIFITAVTRLNFLGNKINDQIEAVSIQKTSAGYYVTQTNRFSSALKDFYDFLDYPLTGLGRNSKTRYKGASMTDYQDIHRNNGVTDFLAIYGIFIFLLYFYLVYKGFYKFSSSKISLIGIIILLIIGFSETYFTKVFFYSLMFLFLINRKGDSFLKKVLLRI